MRKFVNKKYTKVDALIFLGAIVGTVLFFTGHHHGDEGPGVAPVAAHNCDSGAKSSFLRTSIAYAHEDAGDADGDSPQFSQPPPPQAPTDSSNMVKVTMNDHGFFPKEISAHLCDTLVITNTGKHLHQPAVGPHPYHTAYPGLEAKNPLKPGEKFEFLLTRPGNYPLHDHLLETVQARITIAE